jgi:hypothetical protein
MAFMRSMMKLEIKFGLMRKVMKFNKMKMGMFSNMIRLVIWSMMMMRNLKMISLRECKLVRRDRNRKNNVKKD